MCSRFLCFRVFFSLVTYFIGINAFCYPEITGWTGRPTIVFENKESAPLQKNYSLKSHFFAVTASGDEIKLKMTTQSDLSVFAKSKVQVPEVFAAAIATYEIFLLSGEIRVTHKGDSAQQKRNQIRTVFFDLEQPKDADAIIVLDMKEPSVEVQMISGEWPLEFFAYEQKLILKAGQKVKFKGVLAAEGDGLKYDYLLDQRKVPQGKLGTVEKFEIGQFFEKAKAAQKSIDARKAALVKLAADKVRERKAYEDSFLCRKPFGQKDQCAWWVESKKCFRKRCNVSGQWGDVTERPANLEVKCTADYTVSECDY